MGHLDIGHMQKPLSVPQSRQRASSQHGMIGACLEQGIPGTEHEGGLPSVSLAAISRNVSEMETIRHKRFIAELASNVELICNLNYVTLFQSCSYNTIAS